MDTDEAGELTLEQEGTAVDTQKSCAYLKNAIRYTLGLYVRLLYSQIKTSDLIG